MNENCMKRKKKWLEREVATMATVQLVTYNKLGEQIRRLIKLGLIVVLIKLTAFCKNLLYFFLSNSKCGWAVLFVLKFFVSRLYVPAYMHRRTSVLYMYTFFKIPTIHFSINPILTFKTTII